MILLYTAYNSFNLTHMGYPVCPYCERKMYHYLNRPHRENGVTYAQEKWYCNNDYCEYIGTWITIETPPKKEEKDS